MKAAQTINVNVNTAGIWSLTWAYDRLGNRKQQTLVGGNLPGGIGQPNFTINETTNRLTGFSYDNAGNLTGDSAFTYAYDGANRMKQAQQIASPNTTTTSTYLGALRVKKTIGSNTTIYVYSDSGPVAEYVNGSLSKEYIYSGSTLVATVAGNNTTYHHPDHLSNRAETDATGTPVRSFGHFPYGEIWYESSSDPLKFTNYLRDAAPGESGLDYALFRHYISSQGRFMGADALAGSIETPQSLNKYAYSLNDPVNNMDPSGLDYYTVLGNCLLHYSGGVTIDKDGTIHVTVNLEQFCFSGGNGTALNGDPFSNDMAWSQSNSGGGGAGAGNPVNIDRLRQRLWEALVSDMNCLQFLGTYGRVSVLSLLDRIPIDFQNEGSSSIQAVTTSVSDPLHNVRPINPAIHINTNGYFSVKGAKMMMGDSVVATGTLLFQAIVLLHEMAHATGAIPKDANNPTQSNNNTRTVMQRCKDALKKFIGK